MNARRGQFHARQRGSAAGALLLLMLFAVALAGVGWVSVGIVANERWPIRWLELSGNFQRVSAEQLRASLSSRLDTNFFTVDLAELHEVAARFPWVSSVQVQKQWPDTIRVRVSEHVPVAHWNEGRLLSREGEAFSVPEADDLQGLPWLAGPEGRLDEVIGHWREFNDRLAPLGLEITRIELDRRGAWSMLLDNGTRVQLGRDNTHERLARLIASWEPLLRRGETAPRDVDLRYTNGIAVAWARAPGEETRAGS